MDKINQAIAIIKSGRSFDEASKITGLPIRTIIIEWEATQKPTLAL